MRYIKSIKVAQIFKAASVIVLCAVTFPASAQMTKPSEIAPAKVQTPAMPTIDSRYEAVLTARISRADDGLNLFDYAGAKADGDLAIITDYIDALAARDVSAMSAADATAYWANLYNALTLQVVLKNYPVTSIKKIGGGLFSSGPWKKDVVSVGGKALSLDNIEHDILRVEYASPLIHYMVNCASIGCPNLQPKLWRGETLDADRDAAAREFINSARGVQVNGSKLKISSIYDWFKEDFGGNKAGVIAHLSDYAEGDLADVLAGGAKIDGYEYDWSLNE